MGKQTSHNLTLKYRHVMRKSKISKHISVSSIYWWMQTSKCTVKCIHKVNVQPKSENKWHWCIKKIKILWREIHKNVKYGKTVWKPMYTHSKSRNGGVCVFFFMLLWSVKVRISTLLITERAKTLLLTQINN